MATAEVTTIPAVREARVTYEQEKSRQRYLMIPGHPHWSAPSEPATPQGDPADDGATQEPVSRV
jgi:hypothetical protein